MQTVQNCGPEISLKKFKLLVAIPFSDGSISSQPKQLTKMTFTKATPLKPSKSALKKALRSYRAGWIADESEIIVGLLKGHRSIARTLMEFAVSKGWVSANDGGKYDNFHFTTRGLTIRDEVAKTTCAFSGKRC